MGGKAGGRKPGRNYAVTAHDRRRVLQARTSQGRRVTDLAERVGWDKATWYRLEQGRLISTPQLPAVYRALGLDVRLIGRADPEESALVEAYREAVLTLPDQAAKLLRELRELAKRAARFRSAK